MKKLQAWLSLSRMNFYIVAVLPVILGNLLVHVDTGHLNWHIIGWGTLGIFLILLSTHYVGEYFDYETDALAVKLGKKRFSGGSHILQSGIIPGRQALIVGIALLIPAGGVGFLLQFYYRTGLFTIPLGILGILGGLFYTAKPIRWSYRGAGEAWIGFCYGWLTVSTPYYIQTGKFSTLANWLSLPIAFTIFNVILINEFPDYLTDQKAGKKNLVVRFGRAKMSRIYGLISTAAWISYILSIKAGLPIKALLFFTPVFFLSLITVYQVITGGYDNQKKLDGICARTLVVNTGVTLSLILAIS